MPRPLGAIGKVTYTVENGVHRAIDSRMNQWTLNAFGTWTRRARQRVPLYNRFRATKMGRGGARAGSFASRQGSAAGYFTKPKASYGRKVASGIITVAKRKKRDYSVRMRAATATEGHIETARASEYAEHFGYDAVPYNWCHLIGHGAGGGDHPDNIVCGSTHCNSEQLAIEAVLYQFRNRGVSATVAAELEGGTAHLAKTITYHVEMNHQILWTRRIDAHRTTFPTFQELKAVKTALVEAITEYLQRHNRA